MRQSVLRYVSALLVAAVATSVLVGGVIAKGPVPEKPIDSTFESSETIQVETVDVPVESTAVQSAAAPGYTNSGVQASSNIKCKRTTVTRKRDVPLSFMYKLVSWTEWCYDGTHIARGEPEFDHTWRTGVSPSPGTFIKNRGSDDKHVSGGLGDTKHKDKAWGKYQVCRPNNEPPYTPICNPVETITINKTQYGTGDYKPKS